MKFCKKCSKTKSLDNFSKNKTTKDGLAYQCKKCISSYVIQWQKENPDKAKNKSNTWRNKNREQVNSTQSKWRKNNPGKTRAHVAKRHSDKLQRTPPWLTEEDLKKINEFYELANKLSKETGIPHEVDHIIPLRGKNISGLHVPWNLQILTKTENRKKRNQFT